MKSYISSAIKQSQYYKHLAERALSQLSDEDIFLKPTYQENSIAIIMQHMAGNMLSRWTNIWEEDGEKVWRERDKEFEEVIKSRIHLMDRWESGWNQYLTTLESFEIMDLERLVYIRNQGHTLVEAINRQLCHYSYHIGQIVLLAKSIRKDYWKSLSIPLGNSERYNEDLFSKTKRTGQFTDEE
jgi:hypothetical protein